MILYHGSQKIIEMPTYGVGSRFNDYGMGFYCTESKELAKEWACPEIRNGFLNQYELDMNGLSVLNLNGEDYSILNWIALLLKNRHFIKRSPISRQASEYLLEHFLLDLSDYDVIRGYRADDSYFSYAKDFLNNTISVRQLQQVMKLGELGKRIVLMSEKSFGQIRFESYEIADASIYYAKRSDREERAKKAYLSNHGADFSIVEDDLYIRDILAKKVKNDDERIR